MKKILMLVLPIYLFNCAPKDLSNTVQYSDELCKLEYNNPGLLVDLDAGFKALPMPMDFDGDGDTDLLISESGSYAESGIFYFENISGNVEMPVFRRAMKVSYERRRLGSDGSVFQVSTLNGGTHVITPDNVREKLLIYRNVPQNVFWDVNEIMLPDKGYDYLHSFKLTQWLLIDFDGDGIKDLLCAATSPHITTLRGVGSLQRQQAFEKFPKHSQLLYFKNKTNNINPDFADPIEILKQNGESLAAKLSIKPTFADYDNDGDVDYIAIGQVDKQFKFFDNIGTPQKYRFAEGVIITFNGNPVCMESRATIHSTAIDWNKDGLVDLIAGDEDGKISYLKNLGKSGDGALQFEPPRFFQQEARYVDFGALTAPRVFDWDGDGLTDIISGNGVGHIGFIKNLGGKVPVWDAPKLLTVNDEPIRIIPDEALWGYTTVDVADWDHDALPDILVNHHHGNLLWFKNIGTRTSPNLAEPQPVTVQWGEKGPSRPAWVPGTAQDNELLAQWRTSPLVCDFNEDGLNDLVMLDHEGYLAVYMRYRDEDGTLQLNPPERRFVYPSGEPILLNQRTGSSSGRLKITFADWDGDGLDDLIVSSKPAVDWMKNMGNQDGNMVLQYMGRVLSRTLMGHTDGPVVSDWNQDGIPDLLVGTETGTFYYWQRSSYDITTTMTTDGKQVPANYPYFKR